LGGVKGLRDFQTEIAERVGKDRGLERGVEGSTARHTDQKEWLAQRVKEIEKKEKALEKREKKLEADQKTFSKAVKTRVRDWEMPEPKMFEGGKAYRERVEIEVKGKIVRSLELMDEANEKAEKAKSEQVEDAQKMKGFLKQYKDQAQLVRGWYEAERNKYDKLKKDILSAKNVEEINEIRQSLATDRDRGLSR